MASNYRVWQSYARYNGLNAQDPKYRYVYGDHVMQGYNSPGAVVWLIGNWRARKDWDKIQFQIDMHKLAVEIKDF